MKAIFKLAISTSGRYRRDLAVGPGIDEGPLATLLQKLKPSHG